jgi:hypothetical protein
LLQLFYPLLPAFAPSFHANASLFLLGFLYQILAPNRKLMPKAKRKAITQRLSASRRIFFEPHVPDARMYIHARYTRRLPTNSRSTQFFFILVPN